MLPKITQRAPRTKRGAQRQYNAILRAYKIAFAGGGTFGWDSRTFHANWPEAWEKVDELIHLSQVLPE